jgi:hypothetical protein
MDACILRPFFGRISKMQLLKKIMQKIFETARFGAGTASVL